MGQWEFTFLLLELRRPPNAANHPFLLLTPWLAHQVGTPGGDGTPHLSVLQAIVSYYYLYFTNTLCKPAFHTFLSYIQKYLNGMQTSFSYFHLYFRNICVACKQVFHFTFTIICTYVLKNILRNVCMIGKPAGGGWCASPLDCHGRVNQHLSQLSLTLVSHLQLTQVARTNTTGHI